VVERLLRSLRARGSRGGSTAPRLRSSDDVGLAMREGEISETSFALCQAIDPRTGSKKETLTLRRQVFQKATGHRDLSS